MCRTPAGAKDSRNRRRRVRALQLDAADAITWTTNPYEAWCPGAAVQIIIIIITILILLLSMISTGHGGCRGRYGA